MLGRGHSGAPDSPSRQASSAWKSECVKVRMP